MSENCESVRVVLYFNGRVVEGRRGVTFEGDKRPTRMKRNSTINELHDKIRQKLGVQGNEGIAKVTARLWHSHQYIALQVVDDEDIEMVMEEFLNQSRKEFLELYVDIGRREDVVFPVTSVGLHSPRNASSSAAPNVNFSEEDENDPTWVMDDDDDDDDDDENIAEEDRLLAEDASGSEGDEERGPTSTQLIRCHGPMEYSIPEHDDIGSTPSAQEPEGMFGKMPQYLFLI